MGIYKCKSTKVYENDLKLHLCEYKVRQWMRQMYSQCKVYYRSGLGLSNTHNQAMLHNYRINDFFKNSCNHSLPACMCVYALKKILILFMNRVNCCPRSPRDCHFPWLRYPTPHTLSSFFLISISIKSYMPSTF